MAELPDDAEPLAGVLRAYKRNASRLRDVLIGPPESLRVGFTLEASRGGPTTSSTTLGESVHRVAALLRPFMAPGSALELRAVWPRLVETGVLSLARQQEINEAFTEADGLAISLVVDGVQLDARDVYFAYAEGKYFRDDPDAKRRLDAISMGPMQAMLPMLFHDACASYARLALLLLEAVLEVERGRPDIALSGSDAGRCIYCLREDGDRSSDEHVIPESLAGDDVVLTGCVCRSCNSHFSYLDKVLIDFEPVAFLRSIYGPLTKKGKFPRAELREFDVERTAPREIRISGKGKAEMVAPVEQPDGTHKFNLDFTGRKRFDPVVLARALFKIGLGLVAHGAGVEAAIDPRYNAARAFILENRPIGTHLLMQTKCTPSPSIQTWWRASDAGTLVGINVFGLVFAFNLELVPLADSDTVDAAGFAHYWLGEESAASLR